MPETQAPAPPVAADKKVDSAEQSCPLKAKKQCELTKLEVKATYKSTNDPTATSIVTKLTAKKKRRREYIPVAAQRQLGETVVALLGQYDLVIEEIAGFPCMGEGEIAGPANTASVEAETELEGTCSHAEHPRFRMKVANATPMRVEVEPAPIKGEEHMMLEDATWEAGEKKIEIKEIVAPTFKSDISGGDTAFAALFRLIMWVWHANKSLDIELKAESCGVHSATEMGTRDLNALVRVYRDITVAVGVKVPPVRKITESYERTTGVGGTTTTTASSDTNYNTGRQTTINTEETATTFKGTAVFKDAPEAEFALYFKFNELELLLKETRDKAKEQAEGMKKAAENAKKKYEHWSDERAKKAAIDKAIKDAFSDFLTFRDKLELFFDDFVSKVRAIIKAITTVLDLMKKMPQLGFKLTFEIGFLSGDFFFGWAHSPADSSAAKSWALADRYAPLLHKLHVESKITLITFKVEASFGILLDGGALGKAECRVAGSLALEVTWQTMLDAIVGSGASNGKATDVLTQQLTGKSTGNLRATVEVKIAFWSIKKEIGIESGIEVDGRVEWSFMANEVKYSLNVCSLETGWYFYSTDIKTGEATVSRHCIIEARQLMPRIERTEKL